MAEDSAATHVRLTAAWRAVGSRLLAEGYDPLNVTETISPQRWRAGRGSATVKRLPSAFRAVADEIAAAPQPDFGREPHAA